MKKEPWYKKGWETYKKQYKDYYGRDFVTDLKQIREYAIIVLVIFLLFQMCVK